MIKKTPSLFWNTTLYKTICICAMILTPSYLLCFFPQYISVVLLLWGAAILIHDLFNNDRNMFKQTGSILLVLFCVGYTLTILFYAKNDIVSTIHLFCWTILEFFLVFTIDKDKHKDVKSIMKDIYGINRVITILVTITGVISLLCYFFKLSIVFPDPEGLNSAWSVGIIYGRNTGMYNNALTCSNAMLIGCVASIFNLVFAKGKKWYVWVGYISSFVICYLCELTTLTRTHTFGIYIFLFSVVFFTVYQLSIKKNFCVFKRVVASACAAMIVFGLCFVGEKTSKFTMKSIASISPTINVYEVLNGGDWFAPVKSTPEEDSIQNTDAETSLERTEIERLPNFFYPRNELWKVGLQVIPKSPIFGFTAGNKNATSIEYGTTEYISNSKDGIATYHNAYFDIAVSAGLLGLVLMLFFVGIHFVRTIRVLFSNTIEKFNKKYTVGYIVIASYLAIHVFLTCNFLGVLCLTNVSVCIYFWILLGFTSGCNGIILKNSETLSVEKAIARFTKKKEEVNE